MVNTIRTQLTRTLWLKTISNMLPKERCERLCAKLQLAVLNITTEASKFLRKRYASITRGYNELFLVTVTTVHALTTSMTVQCAGQVLQHSNAMVQTVRLSGCSKMHGRCIVRCARQPSPHYYSALPSMCRTSRSRPMCYRNVTKPNQNNAMITETQYQHTEDTSNSLPLWGTGMEGRVS